MFASFVQKTNRKSSARSTRLELENLEGRALMSTLAVLAAPSLAAVWPPPPPAQVQVGPGGTEEVPQGHTILGGIRPGSDVAGIIAVHATGGANDIVLFGKAGGGGVEV
jgi:hypothetical protein